jgi:hypothetical protein
LRPLPSVRSSAALTWRQRAAESSTSPSRSIASHATGWCSGNPSMVMRAAWLYLCARGIRWVRPRSRDIVGAHRTAAWSTAIAFLIASRSRSVSALPWLCSFVTNPRIRLSASTVFSGARERRGSRIGVAVARADVVAAGESIRDKIVRAAFTDAAVIRMPRIAVLAFASSSEMFSSRTSVVSAASTAGRRCL